MMFNTVQNAFTRSILVELLLGPRSIEYLCTYVRGANHRILKEVESLTKQGIIECIATEYSICKEIVSDIDFIVNLGPGMAKFMSDKGRVAILKEISKGPSFISSIARSTNNTVTKVCNNINALVDMGYCTKSYKGCMTYAEIREEKLSLIQRCIALSEDK